ncbi:uncharacterized protein [Montipora foliosa]|uniref:uncharacterized protein isoform X2 n=1 Tax=Montipora foliosa TaxID=591990 RepID=UPI0035F11FF0
MAIRIEGVFILDDERDLPVLKSNRNSTDRDYWHKNYIPSPSNSRPSDYGGPLKSPAMQLNEMRQDVTYEVVSQTGPPHLPTFVVTVKVDGNVYIGRGRSKKKAKHDAAENALRSLSSRHEIRGRQPTEMKQICQRSKIFEESWRTMSSPEVHTEFVDEDEIDLPVVKSKRTFTDRDYRHNNYIPPFSNSGLQPTERKQICQRGKTLEELIRAMSSPEVHTDFIDEEKGGLISSPTGRLKGLIKVTTRSRSSLRYANAGLTFDQHVINNI